MYSLFSTVSFGGLPPFDAKHRIPFGELTTFYEKYLVLPRTTD
jgi:hypothetical protein